MLKELTIGGIAEETGCKIQTIRFYEEIGLLKPPARTEGNQRRYGSDSVKRLQFIRHARDMGFAVDDIRELLRLAALPQEKCRTANEIAHRHLEGVRDRIKKLKKLEKELVRITDSCACQTVADCRVIEALADHGKCHLRQH